MLLLCHQLFIFSHEESAIVVSMAMMNSSTRRLVTYVDFSKATSLSTLKRMNGCCSLFNVVRTKRITWTGDILDPVGYS